MSTKVTFQGKATFDIDDEINKIRNGSLDHYLRVFETTTFCTDPFYPKNSYRLGYMTDIISSCSVLRKSYWIFSIA